MAEKLLKKTIFVLVSGRAGVGKSTFSDFLEEHLVTAGVSVTRKPFAGALKFYAKTLGWDGVKNAKGRKFLQDLGRVCRDYDENIWVSKVIESVEKSFIVPPDVVIADDWRFPNELNFIKNHGLFTTLTLRIGAPDREILKGTPAYNDVSEISLPDADPVLYNIFIPNFGDLTELDNIANKISEFIQTNKEYYLWKQN